MQKQAQLKCIMKATNMRKTMNLLSIDITNAFNSISWDIIDYSLQRANIGTNIR